MRNIKLTLAYDGSHFAGWQTQRQGERTVQGILSDAVERITGDWSPVLGSGRTDSGVHALAQVASFETRSLHSLDVFKRALNAILPHDVRVLDVEDMPATFHPIRDSIRKNYSYLICNAPVHSPFAKRFSWGVSYHLDIEAMREAASMLVGKHDFSSFMAVGSSVRDMVRDVSVLNVNSYDKVGFFGLDLTACDDGCFIRIDVTGSGFLRHMVRIIAGTLVDVGKGVMHPAFMKELLVSGDRTLAGTTAPPEGLFMISVEY